MDFTIPASLEFLRARIAAFIDARLIPLERSAKLRRA